MTALNTTADVGKHISSFPCPRLFHSSIPGKYVWVMMLLGMVVTGCAGTRPATPESTIDREYSFWPPFPAEPRIQFLVSYRSSADIEPARSSFDDLLYGADENALPIQKPYGVEMTNGRIYVCDIRNTGVVVLDLVKHQTRIMGTSGVGGLVQPTDIAIAEDGMIYVADVKRGVIFVFNSEERHVASFGHSGLRPVGLAIHKNNLYVCDFTSQSVLVMDRFSGEIQRSIGEPGSDDGQFVRPLGVAVDYRGRVIVCDVIKCRLQTFDASGKFLHATGSISDTAGSFVRPKHIDVDNTGNVYVTDAAFQNVQLFNDAGQTLMFFGSAGDHPGSMNLPAGLCIHEGDLELFARYIHPDFKAEYLILVTNQFGLDKVSVYAFGQLRGGKSIQDIEGVVVPVATGVQEDDEQSPAIQPIKEPDKSIESSEDQP